jgi:hypothetical protein
VNSVMKYGGIASVANRAHNYCTVYVITVQERGSLDVKDHVY